MTALLPAQFQSLEKFAVRWALPTERERYDERLRSTMGDMQEFYDAVFAQGESILAYLDDFDIDALPDPELNLLRLFYSLIVVSFSVEVFQQPAIPDTGAAQLYFDVEPVP